MGSDPKDENVLRHCRRNITLCSEQPAYPLRHTFFNMGLINQVHCRSQSIELRELARKTIEQPHFLRYHIKTTTYPADTPDKSNFLSMT